MLRGRFSILIILFGILFVGCGASVIYLGNVKPPETTTVHHILSAPEGMSAPANENVTLPDVIPNKS